MELTLLPGGVPSAANSVGKCHRGGGGWGLPDRDALEGEGPHRRPQRRLDRRLEEVARAVGGSYCRLQMPLRLALAVKGTVAGHRLGAWRGGGGYPPPFQCIPASGSPSVTHQCGGAVLGHGSEVSLVDGTPCATRGCDHTLHSAMELPCAAAPEFHMAPAAQAERSAAPISAATVGRPAPSPIPQLRIQGPASTNLSWSIQGGGGTLHGDYFAAENFARGKLRPLS